MERFRVTVRDQSQVIGVTEPGVLSVTLSAVVRDDRGNGPERECSLRLGGLESATKTFIDWTGYELQPGDRIVIEVLSEGSFDEPSERRADIPAVVQRAKANSVRQMAKELGWTLIENNSSPEP